MEETNHEAEIKLDFIYIYNQKFQKQNIKSCNKTSVDGIKFSMGVTEEQISKFVHN